MNLQASHRQGGSLGHVLRGRVRYGRTPGKGGAVRELIPGLTKDFRLQAPWGRVERLERGQEAPAGLGIWRGDHPGAERGEPGPRAEMGQREPALAPTEQAPLNVPAAGSVRGWREEAAVREALWLKRDSSTLTEWSCSISTHARTLTKLRRYEMVKGSVRPRLRPPAALPGWHHPKAGPTPRPAPSFTFTGHLGNGLYHQYPQGCPRAKVTMDRSPPGFLLISRHFTLWMALPQELVGMPRSIPGKPLLGQRVPHPGAWTPLPQPVTKLHPGGGGPAPDTPRSKGRGRWLQPPGGKEEMWQRTVGQRLGSWV